MANNSGGRRDGGNPGSSSRGSAAMVKGRPQVAPAEGWRAAYPGGNAPVPAAPQTPDEVVINKRQGDSRAQALDNGVGSGGVDPSSTRRAAAAAAARFRGGKRPGKVAAEPPVPEDRTKN